MAHSGFRGAMAFALATNAAKVFSSDKTGSSMLTLTIVYASFTVNLNLLLQYSNLILDICYWKYVGAII